MPEEKLNSYRLTSMREPSDAMLNCIMQMAVDRANLRYEQALESYFNEIKSLIDSKKTEWAERYDVVLSC